MSYDNTLSNLKLNDFLILKKGPYINSTLAPNKIIPVVECIQTLMLMLGLTSDLSISNS